MANEVAFSKSSIAPVVKSLKISCSAALPPNNIKILSNNC